MIVIPAWIALAGLAHWEAFDDAYFAQRTATPVVYPPTGSVWALLFDTEGSFADSSPLGLNSTSNGVVSVANGYATLDGASGYISLNDNTNHEFKTNFTACAWVRYHSFVPAGKYPNVVGKGGGNPNGWCIFYHGDEVSVTMTTRNTPHKYSWATMNIWKHFALTWIGGTNYYYVDGICVTNKTALAPAVDASAKTIIGIHYGGTGSYGYMDGDVDDVLLYPYSLPSNVIYQVYQHGKDAGK